MSTQRYKESLYNTKKRYPHWRCFNTAWPRRASEIRGPMIYLDRRYEELFSIRMKSMDVFFL